MHEDPLGEATAGDVAEQRRPVLLDDSDGDEAGEATVEEPSGEDVVGEADPLDVADQRRAVPEEPEEPDADAR
jgi:hypothetical protein